MPWELSNRGFSLGAVGTHNTRSRRSQSLPLFLHFVAYGGGRVGSVSWTLGWKQTCRRSYAAFVHAKLARILGASSVLVEAKAGQMSWIAHGKNPAIFHQCETYFWGTFPKPTHKRDEQLLNIVFTHSICLFISYIGVISVMVVYLYHISVDSLDRMEVKSHSLDAGRSMPHRTRPCARCVCHGEIMWNLWAHHVTWTLHVSLLFSALKI